MAAIELLLYQPKRQRQKDEEKTTNTNSIMSDRRIDVEAQQPLLGEEIGRPEDGCIVSIYDDASDGTTAGAKLSSVDKTRIVYGLKKFALIAVKISIISLCTGFLVGLTKNNNFIEVKIEVLPTDDFISKQASQETPQDEMDQTSPEITNVTADDDDEYDNDDDDDTYSLAFVKRIFERGYFPSMEDATQLA